MKYVIHALFGMFSAIFTNATFSQEHCNVMVNTPREFCIKLPYLVACAAWAIRCVRCFVYGVRKGD